MFVFFIYAIANDVLIQNQDPSMECLKINLVSIHIHISNYIAYLSIYYIHPSLNTRVTASIGDDAEKRKDIHVWTKSQRH